MKLQPKISYLLLTCLLHAAFVSTANNYAVFFAVDNYQKNRDLTNPIKDSEAIAGELATNFQFEVEVVKDPTFAQITSKLTEYRNNFETGKWNQNGQLLIFFTGHGDVKNRSGFFMASDTDPNNLFATGFPYNNWRNFIDGINCKHICVFIDACRSGTFDPNWYNKSGIADAFVRPGEMSEGDRLVATHNEYITRLFFTSAAEVESPDQSQFAKKILEGLRSKSSTFLQDKILTSSELWTFIEKAYPRPHRGEFGQDQPGSSFLFFLDASLQINISESIPSRVSDNILTDFRDGKSYRIFTQGKQRWMMANLAFDVGIGSWCYANNNTNCGTFGRLYTWEAALRACKGLGDSWRLPTRTEIENFVALLGGAKPAYRIFTLPNSSSLTFDFGGIRTANGSYDHQGAVGRYWTQTEKDSALAWYFYLTQKNQKALLSFYDKKQAYSCRCVQDLE